jgi:hypothetical protein
MKEIQLSFDFADEINAAHEAAQLMAAEARSHIAGAVQKALECGQMMLKQKESLSRSDEGWIDWLSRRCPSITEHTARRYMAVAKRCKEIGSNAENDPSVLRQAYLATGLLGDAPEPEEQSLAEKPWVEFVKPLDKFRLWINARRDNEPMDEWGEDALRILTNELQWFINFHAEVQQVRQDLVDNDV